MPPRLRYCSCGRRFRPPVADPEQVACPDHRSAVVLEVPTRTAPPVEGPMVAAVRAELERCRAAGSMAGAIALRLALTLDDPDLAAGSVASLSAQLVRTLEPLQRAAPREPDALDDLGLSDLELGAALFAAAIGAEDGLSLHLAGEVSAHQAALRPASTSPISASR